MRAQTAVDRVRVSVMPARHFGAPESIVVATGTRGVQLSIDRGLPLRARVIAPAAYARAVSCRARAPGRGRAAT